MDIALASIPCCNLLCKGSMQPASVLAGTAGNDEVPAAIHRLQISPTELATRFRGWCVHRDDR